MRRMIEQARVASRINRLASLAPAAIVVVFAAAGYLVFGNQIGFMAVTVAGVALSQIVHRTSRGAE